MSETQKEGKIKAEFDNRPMDLKVDQRSDEQRILDAQASVNTAWVRDINGNKKMKVPQFRDENGKMIYSEEKFREITVPPDEVVFYTQSVIKDWHSSHAATVVLGNDRHGVVFDRTYTYNGRVYYRCAWIPNKNVRAGVVYEKKIDKRSKMPIAVMKKVPETNTECYQIVGGQEADYRDLKRIFERIWIKKGGSAEVNGDEELNKFMYESVAAIDQEVAK